MAARELTALGDPQTRQIGSLLSRMTSDNSTEIKFSKTQVNALIEVTLPRIATGMPGMPEGMKCDVDKLDDDTWNLRITRPKATA